MAGFDERDSTSLERDDEDFTRHLGQPWTAGSDAARPLAGLRIGLPNEYFGAGLADDVRATSTRRSSNMKRSARRSCRCRCRRPSCRFPSTT
jgi:Asp-tRNA(Asn)/Glu-tRNA(Gln) amidotransferase A subunit family amidase